MRLGFLKELEGAGGEWKLRGVNIPNGCSTTGKVVEVGIRDCDIGTLGRDLYEVGERVEEVTELTVLDEQRLRGCQA